MNLRFISPFLIFSIILLFSFSVSVNNFVEIQIINLLFYVFFHLTLIYFLFYYYHYSIYLFGLIYGVLFDIILLNEIGPHLISFILLILLYNFFKKYLFLLSSYQISITILITLIVVLFFEILFAYLFNNLKFSSNLLIKYLIISIIIFIPSIFVFNKLDK